jgi:DNA-binding LacI/PurR family transcriptional regulator
VAVTIRDVAERAGVSKAAVSYVLNAHPSSIRLSEHTKERIRTAVRELGYHPNSLARSLSGKSTNTIRLVPQFADWLSVWSGFTSEMMQGISDVVLQEGYDVTLQIKAATSLADDVAVVTDGRADGALLWRLHNDLLGPTLQDRDFPCVLMFEQSERPDMCWVDCDNILGGRIATEYLLDLGHRRIVHLRGYDPSGTIHDRCIGYEQALLARGITPEPDWVLDVNRMRPIGEHRARIAEMLRREDRPTAVFCWYDGLAIDVLEVASSLNLRVPQDLSVIGYDSTAMCNHTDPQLTSIKQPIREIARTATGMLLQRIRGEAVEHPQVLLSPLLEQRASCSFPATRP